MTSVDFPGLVELPVCLLQTRGFKAIGLVFFLVAAMFVCMNAGMLKQVAYQAVEPDFLSCPA